jgi:hypothetical protein
LEVILEKLANIMLVYPFSNKNKVMGKLGMQRSLRRIVASATLVIAGLLAVQANAALTLEVSTSTATDFDFTVTGDFSGYAPPLSLTNFLYIVPMDSGGNPVTTWVPSEQYGERPDGAIDGDTISGWAFIDSNVRSDEFSFLTGDGFNVSFGGGPYDASSVMTSPYTRSQSGLTLNPEGIDHFNLYWGRTVLLASTGAVVAAPATPIPTLSSYGLVLTILVLLVLAGFHFRTSARRS